MLRTVIYIDGQNLRYKLEPLKLQEKDVDWGKVFAHLTPPDHRLIRANWYQAAKIAPWEWNPKYHNKLCPPGMSLPDFQKAAESYYKSECERLEHLHRAVYGRIEEGFDSIEDLVSQASEYDHATLVSGDFDYVPAIQVVKDMLRRITVVSVMKGVPPKHQGQARRLRGLCDSEVFLYEVDLKGSFKYAPSGAAPQASSFSGSASPIPIKPSSGTPSHLPAIGRYARRMAGTTTSPTRAAPSGVCRPATRGADRVEAEP